jgi:hypothetical protein
MILLKKRAHLVLKTPSLMARFLRVNVVQQCFAIRRSDGERTIPALPREARKCFALQPNRRVDHQFLHWVREIHGRVKTNRKMDMISDATDAVTIAALIARNRREIGVQLRKDRSIEHRATVSGAEDNVDQQKTQRLGYEPNYISRLLRSDLSWPITWGFTPGWYRVAPLALVSLALLMECGCKPSPKGQTVTLTQLEDDATKGKISEVTIRPDVAPPPIKLFHKTADSLTLVTNPDASDAQIKAILFELHDAARAHTFDKLGIPQKFIDARDPIVWFHIYRGPKCASEKYTTGKLPCGASYHAAGDYTLGGFTDHNHDDGVLLHDENHETHLW